MVNTHNIVKESGKCNYEGCRISINTRLNIDYIKKWLWDYKDKKLCEFLEYGFPLGYQGNDELLNDVDAKSLWKYRNHKGAEDYPEDMKNYLMKEISNNAIIGPFKKSPFKSGIKISPLNTVPKKDSSERRVILDLSYPRGLAINDFLDKKVYLGEKIDLVYPKVDDFIQIIKQKGPGCLLFKKDLRRAFRQIPLCPSSYNLVAFAWKKHIFCDTVIPMALFYVL